MMELEICIKSLQIEEKTIQLNFGDSDFWIGMKGQ